jgi:hypothetical protein
MKRTSLLLLAILAAACGAAAHAATPAVSLAASTAGDSVRVVATWRLGCDALGCGDSARVAWEVGGTPRRLQMTAAAADTLWIPMPAWRDSALVVVRVSTLRRGLVSAPETDTVVVHRADAPPPPPDSVRVDTVALRRAIEDAAFRDSFPVAIVRDTLGLAEGSVLVGQTMPLCLFSRNRFTGELVHILPYDASDETRTEHQRRCERAFTMVAEARDS